MADSFFEKLTGASVNQEEEEFEKQDIKTEAPKKKMARKKRSDSGQKDVKKTPKTMPKKEPTKKPLIEVEEEKEDWLEEAEAEEGQLTIDVYQTESDIVIKSTVAGVNPENIDIDITNDMITIRGKRAKDEKIETENYYYQELYWGAFSRSVILPVEVDADKAKASIKNGILTVSLPKIEKAKTKKIKVRAFE